MRLANLCWPDAAVVLARDPVVLLPMGRSMRMGEWMRWRSIGEVPEKLRFKGMGIERRKRGCEISNGGALGEWQIFIGILDGLSMLTSI